MTGRQVDRFVLVVAGIVAVVLIGGITLFAWVITNKYPIHAVDTVLMLLPLLWALCTVSSLIVRMEARS